MLSQIDFLILSCADKDFYPPIVGSNTDNIEKLMLKIYGL